MPRKKLDHDAALSSRPAQRKPAKTSRDLPAPSDSGGLAWRPKITKKADESFPLKLTRQQRDSLIHCTRIKKKFKDRIQAAGAGTRVISVSRKELEYLWGEIATASVFVADPDKRRLVTVMGKVTDLLDAAEQAPTEEGASAIRKTAPTEGMVIYQFKVALLEIQPAIWRRIQVTDCTLAELHLDIQAAFGWWNYHLHQFEIDGEQYGPRFEDELGLELDTHDEADVSLSQLIPKSGRKVRWLYDYDFGDGWRHSIQFEGFAAGDPGAKYPRCVDGLRACPPEDCGGPWGYVSYLEAIGDPKHEQHEDMLRWNGPFDPEAFDAKKATREMRKVRKLMSAEE